MWSPALARLRIAKVLGGLAGRQEQGRDAAFERGDALLDDVLGRVHDPGVDVAGLGEAEQRGGVLGAVERVGRGLVDRQRPRVGRDVRRLAGVDLLGLERPARARVVRATIGRAVVRGCRCSWRGSPVVMGRLWSRVDALSDNCARRTSACLLWGPVTTDPRLPVAVAATQPGHHPGHPTAVGGLPASKPGLDAGTHDRRRSVSHAAEWVPAGVMARRSP